MKSDNCQFLRSQEKNSKRNPQPSGDEETILIQQKQRKDALCPCGEGLSFSPVGTPVSPCLGDHPTSKVDSCSQKSITFDLLTSWAYGLVLVYTGNV